jgi:hypothetical protein
VNGSSSGDDAFGQSSPAAKVDEIYSTFDKTTTMPSSRSTQAAFSANCPFLFLPSDAVPVAAI